MTQFSCRCKKKTDLAIMYEDENDEILYGLVEDLNDHKSFTVSQLVSLLTVCHITKFQPPKYDTNFNYLLLSIIKFLLQLSHFNKDC